jgi:hypothetical protein
MNHYVLFAYCIGFALLWGQAVSLWMESRTLRNRRRTGGRP